MFRTPVSLKPVKQPITLGSNLLSWGSCFADFMGGQLRDHKFRISSNPLGIIFHPVAQFEIFRMALCDELPLDHSYLCNQGIWYNYHFHSSISNSSKSKLQANIKKRMADLQAQLTSLDYLLLTFGTAIQYRHKSTGLLVANCHKIPQQEFEKSLTGPEIVTEAFANFISLFKSKPPRIILSVSPIRHLKEGIENNSVSKSVLRVACEQIKNQFPEVIYFPGYELMMDDLRDYRFYEKDMIHPNETARAYIWELFKTNYLDDAARKFVDHWQKISQNLNHKPFHPRSAAHQEFINQTLDLLRKLPESIDTSREVAMLKKQLT